MQATKFCQKCKRNIYLDNFVLHEAMCRGPRDGELFRSRVIDSHQDIWNQNPPQPTVNNCGPNDNIHHKSSFKKMKSQIPTNQLKEQNLRRLPSQNTIYRNQGAPIQLKPSITHPKNSNIQAPQQIISRNRPPVEQQRFPCPDCGYNMTMLQLDTHPNNCKVKKGKCQYCNSLYPLSLLNDHIQVCNSRVELSNRHGARERQGTSASIIRRNSDPEQREVIDHYHFVDEQGRQMCAQVTRDSNGNRYTNTRPANNSNPNFQSNPLLAMLNIIGSSGFAPNGNSRGRNPNIIEANVNGNFFEQMVFALMNRMNIAPQNKRPLDNDLLKKLPIVVYNKNNIQHQGSTSCTVCMTDFENGDQLILLPCGHLFNKECIVPWLKGSSLCPNCRQPIKPGTKPSHSNNYQQNRPSNNAQLSEAINLNPHNMRSNSNENRSGDVYLGNSNNQWQQLSSLMGFLNQPRRQFVQQPIRPNPNSNARQPQAQSNSGCQLI